MIKTRAIPEPAAPPMPTEWEALGLIVPIGLVALPDGIEDIGMALRHGVTRHPRREALVGRHSRYSFAELDRAIDAAAYTLAALGVRRGDRVAATAKNDPDIVVAFHAVQRVGAIWVGISRQLSATEKAFQLRDCGVSVYLADAISHAAIRAMRGELPDLVTIIDMEPSPSGNEWRRLVEENAGRAPPRIVIDRAAPATIGYTSGTTGFPKGVAHSQHNLLVATSQLEVPGVTRQGCVMPLTILNVMINHAIGVLRRGITLICIDRADTGGILEMVMAEKVDGFRAPPPILYDMLSKPDFASLDLSGIVYLASAGAGASTKLRKLYEQRFGRRMLDGYGLTESPGVVTRFLPGDRPDETAIGWPLPHLELRILDEAGGQVPDGEPGEICIRAVRSGPWAGVYTPMLGYWKQPDATARALRHGWLHTGDIGYRDSSGMFFINARGNDMILRGGANIYPREIERVIHEDPRVREAVAFGMADERLGQIVAVAVEFFDGADPATLRTELILRVEQELAKFKRPEFWLLLPALPRNAMGKIDRQKLREFAAYQRADSAKLQNDKI